jgi:FlaA1/EpsC-like NDP-sugar epimerase
MGRGGETFVLDMGEQIKIVNLAEDLIRLSGFEPRKDIDIIFTGIRDGEKLSEDLWNDDRKLSGTDHPEISREEGQVEIQGKELEEIVENLVNLSRQGQGEKIIDYLNKLITNADIKHNINENLFIFDL